MVSKTNQSTELSGSVSSYGAKSSIFRTCVDTSLLEMKPFKGITLLMRIVHRLPLNIHLNVANFEIMKSAMSKTFDAQHVTYVSSAQASLVCANAWTVSHQTYSARCTLNETVLPALCIISVIYYNTKRLVMYPLHHVAVNPRFCWQLINSEVCHCFLNRSTTHFCNTPQKAVWFANSYPGMPVS
ncbi:hypothetical protein BsWGS_02920 [Bradybaena similaris]